MAWLAVWGLVNLWIVLYRGRWLAVYVKPKNAMQDGTSPLYSGAWAVHSFTGYVLLTSMLKKVQKYFCFTLLQLQSSFSPYQYVTSYYTISLRCLLVATLK